MKLHKNNSFLSFYDTIANNAAFTTYGAARANVKGLSIFVR